MCAGACVAVGREWKWTRKWACAGVFSACWPEADGRIGTVNRAQQREEGVFSHRRWLAAAETGRGRAVYPGAQFLCYLSHCFFPHSSQSSWGSRSTKALALSQPPKPGLQSGVCYLSQTLTQNISYLTSNRYSFALLAFNLFKIWKAHMSESLESRHWKTHPSRPTLLLIITSVFQMHKRHHHVQHFTV